ncbi:MAG: glycosyltransferase family 1 protein [Bacillota bacterium]|jgi:glycosyltransferase involved in cell wall biosynthesis|nr:glycosyltransferase family 1 protein [Bacillota bacterium]
MKIAIFTDTYSPQINGVTNTLGRMSDYFSENEIQYKIFAPKYEVDDDLETERFYSLKFHFYPDCRIALPNIFRINQTLSDFKPDLIHLMTEFNMGLTGMRYGLKNNIPTISNYTTNFSQYTDYYGLDFLKQGIWDYMKWFHNQNCLTLCPSAEARKLLEQNDICKTAIFSRGIDSSTFHPSKRNSALRSTLGTGEKTVFLYVGRVSYEKDLDLLIDSYSHMKEKYGSKAVLMITGDGPYLQKLRQLLPGDTVFTGFKTGNELAELYASADIFVCPSSTETFGNVILEAMASGLAVIGADAGGVKEIITHGKNGLKFTARNREELIFCMSELMENIDLRRRLAQGGISHAASQSWKMIIGGLMRIYEKVLEDRGLEKALLSKQGKFSA